MSNLAQTWDTHSSQLWCDRSLPVSVSVYQTMLQHIPNYHSLWMFCAEFIKQYLPELCIQHERRKHKVYIFLVSVTGMYLNQLNTIVNVLWNISHTTILECAVPFVSRCTNLVLWELHFDTVSDMCTEGHNIKQYLNQNGWLLVSVKYHTKFLLLLLSPLHYYFPSFFLWGRKYIT